MRYHRPRLNFYLLYAVSLWLPSHIGPTICILRSLNLTSFCYQFFDVLQLLFISQDVSKVDNPLLCVWKTEWWAMKNWWKMSFWRQSRNIHRAWIFFGGSLIWRYVLHSGCYFTLQSPCNDDQSSGRWSRVFCLSHLHELSETQKETSFWRRWRRTKFARWWGWEKRDRAQSEELEGNSEMWVFFLHFRRSEEGLWSLVQMTRIPYQAVALQPNFL